MGACKSKVCSAFKEKDCCKCRIGEHDDKNAKSYVGFRFSGFNNEADPDARICNCDDTDVIFEPHGIYVVHSKRINTCFHS